MNTHPYLRAYMAGIVVPTLILLLVLTAFCLVRFVFQVPVPIERVIIFPMALVPSLFGLWNMFYLWLRPRRLPIGIHGALLPFLLAPCGLALASAFGFLTPGSGGIVCFDQRIIIPYQYVGLGFTIGLIAYYLIWKYLVAFFNQVLGIA